MDLALRLPGIPLAPCARVPRAVASSFRASLRAASRMSEGADYARVAWAPSQSTASADKVFTPSFRQPSST
jgi:hypothetical protein